MSLLRRSKVSAFNGVLNKTNTLLVEFGKVHPILIAFSNGADQSPPLSIEGLTDPCPRFWYSLVAIYLNRDAGEKSHGLISVRQGFIHLSNFKILIKEVFIGNLR